MIKTKIFYHSKIKLVGFLLVIISLVSFSSSFRINKVQAAKSMDFDKNGVVDIYDLVRIVNNYKDYSKSIKTLDPNSPNYNDDLDSLKEQYSVYDYDVDEDGVFSKEDAESVFNNLNGGIRFYNSPAKKLQNLITNADGGVATFIITDDGGNILEEETLQELNQEGDELTIQVRLKLENFDPNPTPPSTGNVVPLIHLVYYYDSKFLEVKQIQPAGFPINSFSNVAPLSNFNNKLSNGNCRGGHFPGQGKIVLTCLAKDLDDMNTFLQDNDMSSGSNQGDPLIQFDLQRKISYGQAKMGVALRIASADQIRAQPQSGDSSFVLDNSGGHNVLGITDTSDVGVAGTMVAPGLGMQPTEEEYNILCRGQIYPDCEGQCSAFSLFKKCVNFNQFLNLVLSWVTVFAVLFFLVRLAIGFYVVTGSSGNPARLEEGRGIITYAIVGLLIIATAWAVLFLLNQVADTSWRIYFGF